MRRVSNEDVITALFLAPSEAKSRALEILQGRASLKPECSPQLEYMTTKEACEFFRCSRMTLHRAEIDGQIRSVHLRGKKLFERAELIKALKSGRGKK